MTFPSFNVLYRYKELLCEEIQMQDLVKFLKEIFMFKGDDCKKIGLSQFKTTTPVEKKQVKTIKPASEVKLSDLMRRSY